MKEIITGRLTAFRNEMKKAGVSAAVIPQTDPHLGEYIASHWQVRRWLSGFTGSAGTLVITDREALLWTDSRYFLQAGEQLADTGIVLMKEGLPDTPSIPQYLIGHLVKGSTVGIDGLLFPATDVVTLKSSLEKHGLQLDPLFAPIDIIWQDRPDLPDAPLYLHDEKYAGKSAADKITSILAAIKEQGAESILISDLAELAWTLNVRSSDVSCNPVATGFLFLSPTLSVLFIKEEKLTPEISDFLAAANVKTAPYDSLLTFLAQLPASATVLYEAPRTAYRIVDALGERAVAGASPIPMMKSVKNSTQIAGIRNAMEKDGVALVGAFMEIERRLATGEPLTELDVADILTEYRSQQELYIDESFETIAGYGPHGAIVHYSATPESSVTVNPEGLLLIDSGAQYLDGTTDITRTIAVGPTTEAQRHDFTLVMKGHIALATAIFPEGTRGDQLDSLARQFLWKEGLSYLHGTGHGVGHFLNVHEGPQSIRLNHVPVALKPGMLTSNEPGLYRAGAYGIRCENLVLTVDAFTTEFGRFYRFEPVTLFPWDRSLFDTSIMTREEINWVNGYHEEVYNRLSPRLNDAQKDWLRKKTLPLPK
ncbi:MAG: aminopeptidase P family protein [Muribaculaceae bacterium]|nr:aminopeptidase P family protein [Muribaculaceae bacterium]